MKPEARDEDDRRRQDERDPFPAGELQRRHHREQRDRHGQDDREDEPPGQHRRAARRGDDAPRAPARPAGRRSRPTRPRRRAPRRDPGSGAHGRLLGREVDRRLDAVELVQPLLDARGAGGAGHPLEIEADLSLSAASRACRHYTTRGYLSLRPPRPPARARCCAAPRLLPVHQERPPIAAPASAKDRADQECDVVAAGERIGLRARPKPGGSSSAESATLARAASPSAPPIMNDVLMMPEARPASCGAHVAHRGEQHRVERHARAEPSRIMLGRMSMT